MDRRRDPLHWFRVRAQGSRDSRSGSTAAGQAAAGCVARMPAAAGRPRLRRTPSRRRNGVRANSIPRAEFDPLFLFLFDPLFLCVRDSIASMRQVCTRLMTCRRLTCEARTDAGSRYGALQRIEFGRSGHPHGAGRRGWPIATAVQRSLRGERAARSPHAPVENPERVHDDRAALDWTRPLRV